MDLLATLEALRKIQSECNMYDGPLASSMDAWGYLDKAMRCILAEHYRRSVSFLSGPQRVVAENLAGRMADRVVDEVYDNGENFTYNMHLLATGVIEIYEGEPQHE